MKLLIAVLISLFIVATVEAFKPQDLMDAKILASSPCSGRICFILEKDKQNYLVVGVVNEDEFVPVEIYSVINGKLSIIWNILWKDV